MINLILFIFLSIFLNGTKSSEVDEKFISSKIVDELIAKAPDELLDVEFDCGLVTLGSVFAPIQVRNMPKVTWKRANESEWYTLIMTSVEGKGREFLHWLDSNIAGNNVERGDMLTMFFPSAPPKNTGEHRFAFLWYKQPKKIDFQGYLKISTFQMTGRDEFSTKRFAEQFNLGTPVAGNFYLASWDESCDELNKLVNEYRKRTN